jgi:hypothetical protein
MLLLPWLPALHISNLAKPATWGYMLFGQDFGLTWFWWFSPFFCFSALLLLLHRVFKGDTWLAILGAGWFTCSGYNIAWSLTPSYFVGFGAFTTFAAYQLFLVKSVRGALVWGSLLGYGAVGFFLGFYPPWMIPLAYAFLAIFVGLVWREHLATRGQVSKLLIGGVATLATAALLFVPWYLASRADLIDMANTVYPGNRRVSGGDCSFSRLFGAFHNVVTMRNDYIKSIGLSSEASGFFLYYPLLLLAVLFRRDVRQRLDKVGWLLLGLGGAMIWYCIRGWPVWLSELTFMSRSPGFRAQIAIGLISIVSSLYLLVPSPGPAPAPRSRKEILLLILSVAGFAAVALASEIGLNRLIKIHPTMGRYPWPILLTAGLATLGAVFLVLGRRRWFGILLAMGLVATGADYNPLSVSFPSIYNSQLRKVIRDIVREERQVDRNSYWLAIGGPGEPILGTVAAVMGARSLTAAFFHPQLEHWRKMDPSGTYETIYNRYSETHYIPRGWDDKRLFFTLPSMGNFNLHASPNHPLLVQMGVRYAISCYKDGPLNRLSTQLIGETQERQCRIWRLQD